MNAFELEVTLSGNRQAVLRVPQPLTPETLRAVEDAVAGRLAAMRCELDGGGADEGAREYASWIRQLRAAHG